MKNILKNILVKILAGNPAPVVEPKKFLMVYAPERLAKLSACDIYIVTNPAESAPLFKEGIKVGFITSPQNRPGEVRAFRFDRVKLLTPLG